MSSEITNIVDRLLNPKDDSDRGEPQMDLRLLEKYGFSSSEEIGWVNYRLRTKQGHKLSLSLGPVSYCRPRAVTTHYSDVEIAFISVDGDFIFPNYLPLGFPGWDGGVFAYVPVEWLCSLLPVVCSDFKYERGMVVQDDVNGKSRLSADEYEGSTKLDAVNQYGAFSVLDKRSVRLCSLS